jgi:Zn-dependent protease
MFERISRRERIDLLIAWGAISIAFAIITIAPNGILSPTIPVTPVHALIILGVSLLTVGIAFVLHEIAHKYTAIKFGYRAEFYKDNNMLVVMMALASLVGMVFAVPGATVVYENRAFGGGINREQNGKISAAGPVINLLLCIPFAILFLIFGGLSSSPSDNLLLYTAIKGVQINAMIAAFNLLPISILDGRKVWAWSKGIFIILIVAAFGILLLSFYPSLL